MRQLKTLILTAALLVLLAASAALAANVAQGSCVSFDPNTNVLIINEFDLNFTDEHRYGQPTGTMIEFDTAKAKIGMMPEPGDILRLSFTSKDGKNTALKVMNVSKQDLMKK
jgi:hypothetical protein